MNIDDELLKLLPPLSRARGDRLYQHGKKWWIDLFKENGAYLWGRKPKGIARIWKNQLDKGLAGLLPSHFDRRLKRHLKDLFPFAHQAVFFRNAERAIQTLKANLQDTTGFHQWHDPALSDHSQGSFSFWRPYLSKTDKASVIYPLLPWAQAQARIVLFTDAYIGPIPSSDLVAATELSALICAVVMTVNKLNDPKKKNLCEAAWRLFDQNKAHTTLFEQRGPYLSPRCSSEKYPLLFQEFLDHGFLLSPDSRVPSILPTSMSAGEWKKFSAVFENKEWITSTLCL